MIIPKLAIWKGFPFRYRDVGRSPEANLEVVKYIGGPFYDVVENSRGPSMVKIQAVFLGPVAETEKAGFNIVAALPGPGTLIHPDLGIMTAYLKSWPESSTGNVRGQITLDLEFIPLVEIPGTEIAFAAALSAANLTMLLAGAVEFLANAPDDGDSAAASAMTAANAAAASAMGDVSSLVSADNQNSLFMALQSAALAATADTVAAWDTVAALVDTRQAAETALDEIMVNWQAAIDLQATNYTQGISTATMYEYVAAAMSARLSELTLNEAWETYDDAMSAATALYATLESVIMMMTGPGVIRAAIDARATAYTGLLTNALKLPKRRIYTNNSVASSVELAFRLFGDMDRADEIESDNDIVHPAFIGQSELRVLTE